MAGRGCGLVGVVADATRNHLEILDVSGYGYGYQWWTSEAGGRPAAVALGFGGQVIEVVPDHDLVMRTSTIRVPPMLMAVTSERPSMTPCSHSLDPGSQGSIPLRDAGNAAQNRSMNRLSPGFEPEANTPAGSRTSRGARTRAPSGPCGAGAAETQ